MIFKRNKHKVRLSYRDFLLFHHCTKTAYNNELIERLNNQPPPTSLCGHECLQTLNEVSYGTLDAMQRISEEEDFACAIIKILLDVDAEEVMKEDVNKVWGFVMLVKREIERINKLFASIKQTYSDDEIRAGVKNLSFGTFGVLDWYARRMGIADQTQVMDIGWIRIYQCMKNDNDKAEYERRLSDIHLKKSKSK